MINNHNYLMSNRRNLTWFSLILSIITDVYSQTCRTPGMRCNILSYINLFRYLSRPQQYECFGNSC